MNARSNRVIVLAALALGVSVGMAAAQRAGVSASVQPVTAVHVVEHALTDNVVDIGKKGDSLGDRACN